MSRTGHRPAAPRDPNAASSFWRDPDLPGIEVRCSSFKAVSFPRHIHDSYSVGFVETGGSRAFLRGRSGQVEPGDIVIVHPGEVHACNPMTSSGWGYRMFFLRPELLARAARDLGLPVRAEPGFDSPVVRDPALLALLRGLHASMERGDPAMDKEAALLKCLARLLTRHACLARRREPEALPGDVDLARQWLHAHAWDKVRLEDLAAVTGRSRYAVLRAFRRATGLSPHAYQSQIRVARARKLLAAGLPIAQVALETGFADQSQFTHAFKKIMAATPGQYQRRP